jgi:hypothetical protein
VNRPVISSANARTTGCPCDGPTTSPQRIVRYRTLLHGLTSQNKPAHARPAWLTSLHRFSEPFRDTSGVRRPAVFPVVSRRFRPGSSHETLHFLEPFPAARDVTRAFSVPLRDMTSRVRKCHRL